jgi:hypothetical protein
MKQIEWNQKQRGKPNVSVVQGEDGDLYAAYEGGVPLRIRDLLKLWYASVKQGSELHKSDYLLKKADQKWIAKHREWLEGMEYTSNK